MENKKSNIEPTSPAKLTGLILKSPKKVAAGLGSIFAALKHASKEIGLIQSLPTLLKANQRNGFDCPGCAWPDPEDHRSSIGEYCENGVKAIAEEATKESVSPEFFQLRSIEALSQQSDFWLGKQGRITHPVILREGKSHYEKIEWIDAFHLIANKLNLLNSSNEAIFYTSGRTSNEAAFLQQLFVRMYGTNNLPDCSNMCHESSGVALKETLGIGKGSVKLEDFEHAQVIVISGQNPGTNHPRMMSALKKAKHNGAKIIAINPLKEAGLLGFQDPQNPGDILGKPTTVADLYLQVNINGDLSLIKALLWHLWQYEKEGKNVFDHDFINTYTSGYEELIQQLNLVKVDDLIQSSGVSAGLVKEAADMLANHDRIIWCWAMGLTQHINAVATIREIVNLLLLKGSIGKSGAGTCPVRGHSNVQGDRTMGITSKPSSNLLNKLKEVFEFEPPISIGYDVVESIQAMKAGKVKVFFAMGGNFLSASPDTNYTASALSNCDLTVHVSTKINRSHLITGKESIILPCLGRTEQDIQASGAQIVTVENSMGIVHRSQGHRTPVSSHLKSEPYIIAELAYHTLGAKYNIDWRQLVENYDLIRDLIAKVIPGCENYNSRVRQSNGFYLPNDARESVFHTPSGKAIITVNELSHTHLKNDEYLMMTIRSHDQFNTTIYGLNDRYRGILNERRVIMMNPKDIEREGLSTQQEVDLSSESNEEIRWARKFLVVPYDIPSKCVATYFPEANPLIPIHITAEKSNTPISKSVQVRIHPT